MKRAVCLLCVFCFTILSVVAPIGASSTPYDSLAARVTQIVNNNNIYSVNGYRTLYSAYGDAEYVLISLNPYGYAVYNNNSNYSVA